MPYPTRSTLPALLGALALALAATSIATARPAHAGSCGGDEAVLDTVKDVERYAKRGGAQPELGEYCIQEALYEKKLEKRLFAACEKILAREPGYTMCLFLAADAGKLTFGGVDIYAAIVPLRGFEVYGPQLDGAYNVGLYKRLGDPRALAPVLAEWKATASNPRIHKRRDSHLWKVFRNNAIALFEKVGGQAERDFLAAEAAATKDSAMKKRMTKAIAAIDKRLARKP